VGATKRSPGTIRHHLNTLSSLYGRAQSEGKVPLGFNPVSSMLDKPTGAPEEAKWLLVHEAALLLESARTYTPKRPDVALPFIIRWSPRPCSRADAKRRCSGWK
jgi:hypothetical protein